jgi:hypothetical protein
MNLDGLQLRVWNFLRASLLLFIHPAQDPAKPSAPVNTRSCHEQFRAAYCRRMSFLRSRHEQLADHLRGQIARGQLREPLPNTRDWASQLGVSCATLYEALNTLKREKLIVVRPRQGIKIIARTNSPPVARDAKVVRIVYRGSDYPEFFAYANWCGLLSQRLQTHGIQLSIERCTDVRLHALARSGNARDRSPNELLFLRSLSEKYQRLFAKSGRPSLIVGYPAPGISLPYVTCDLEGAIRHAAHSLFRHGFTRVVLLINRVRIHAVQRQCDAFEAACASWPHQPVRGEIVRVPLLPATQVATLHR